MAPPLHVLPQVPQLAGSVCVSVQVVPHAVWPPSQTQLPATQLWPSLHMTPHAPQLCASLVRSRQPSPHDVFPGEHLRLTLPQPTDPNAKPNRNKKAMTRVLKRSPPSKDYTGSAAAPSRAVAARQLAA